MYLLTESDRKNISRYSSQQRHLRWTETSIVLWWNGKFTEDHFDKRRVYGLFTPISHLLHNFRAGAEICHRSTGIHFTCIKLKVTPKKNKRHVTRWSDRPVNYDGFQFYYISESFLHLPVLCVRVRIFECVFVCFSTGTSALLSVCVCVCVCVCVLVRVGGCVIFC